MAAEAAAVEAAKATIKEREEFVKRLEREKEKLENMLAEHEKTRSKSAVAEYALLVTVFSDQFYLCELIKRREIGSLLMEYSIQYTEGR